MDQRLKRVKLTILPKLIHEFNAFKSVLNRRLLAKTKVAEKKKKRLMGASTTWPPDVQVPDNQTVPPEQGSKGRDTDPHPRTRELFMQQLPRNNYVWGKNEPSTLLHTIHKLWLDIHCGRELTTAGQKLLLEKILLVSWLERIEICIFPTLPNW